MCDKNTQDAAQWNRVAVAVAAPAPAAATQTTTTAARGLTGSVKNTKIVQNMPDLVANANANAVQAQSHLYMDNLYHAANVVPTARYSPHVQHGAIDSSGKLSTAAVGSSGFVAPFPAAISPALEMSTNPYAVDMLKKVKTQQMEYVKKMNSSIEDQQAHTSKIAVKTMDSLEADNLDKPLYGVIPNKLADHVLNVISVPPSPQVQASVAPVHGRIFGLGVAKELDMKNLSGVQQLVESGVK